MIEIVLPMPPSLNKNTKFGRGRAYSSREYKRWMHDALWIIHQQHGDMSIEDRVNVEIELCGNGRGDADNRSKAAMDSLVKSGLLANDSKKYVRGVHTFWSDHDLGGDCVVRISVASASEQNQKQGQRDGRPSRLPVHNLITDRAR